MASKQKPKSISAGLAFSMNPIQLQTGLKTSFSVGMKR